MAWLLYWALSVGSMRAAQAASELTPWPVVGGNEAGQKYSPLADINKTNVSRLKLAWRYNHGDYSTGNATHGPTALEVTPLETDGTLYFCTPYSRVIALDAESGRERWTFDPKAKLDQIYDPLCRGVAYWKDTAAASGAACATRVFTTTLDSRLLAVDARTGKPCESFGPKGAGLNLLDGLGDVRPAEYYPTSAPLIINDLVLTGAFIRDGQRVHAPSGAVRAFDARTGELRWVWDPVPPSMKPVTADDLKKGATLTRGTPNVWGTMSADPEHNLVFLPTGNPSPDHYGGAERENRDYYGSSVVALDASTGAVRWHFQTVHHDLWDYDVAAQPVLYDYTAPNRTKVPALIVATKVGYVFLLNRLTGEPIFPVEERPVPQSTVPGEHSSPTQPFPSKPRPLHPQRLDSGDIWGLTFWDKGKCAQEIGALDYRGLFTPPSLEGSLEYPGLGGGINWGGVSVDPVTNRMVVSLQTAPFVIQLVPRAEYAKRGTNPPSEKPQPQRTADATAGGANASELVALNPQEGAPYVAVRKPLLSPLMTPCTRPPWGKLVSIDLNRGEVLWERTLGNLHGLAPLLGGWLDWGTPNSGGSLQTRSGLIFIAATMDSYFRAFDATSGAELWRYQLPYGGQATPMTYRARSGGKQYLVIAAGGHGPLGTTPGDAIVAFTLEDSQ
jgi:quinoprotein glucose dehydrogenase